ncbi:MAG: ABC transporter, permease protein 1 (cluster 1, maltose/g3p/polyamine/iron) [uncultured Thermomicrobiales bacterium]|uniref:ABC transporter, permease protein 1 (Cluster 1, maltose/g3p/polyamine/iron) n=1 Tax=uncultured Thermomicrobiales bacterium TaxID=1645740 RepID=A0A6J4VB53_9BACT|nr:MAG: ABC transporter, permease protein 1 (cluster 1, maltose/g3p/polyamine/iron) [uncultured Thermomicrobiales bacterium]
MATLGRRKSRNPIAAEDAVAGWIFIAPALIILSVFIFWPIAQVFWVSFHEWSLIEPERPFRGLANFRELFQDPDFEIALRNTLWFSLGVVPTQTFLGVLLAVIANRAIPGKGFFRTAFYFPSISSSVVISVIFIWLYQQNGLINYVLRAIGFSTPQPPWLSNPKGVIEMALGYVGIDNVTPWLAGPSVALLSIMMMNIWTTMGSLMVIFLAGLQGISGDVYEAASLDGATKRQQFFQITIPLLRPVIFFVTTLGFIGTFQVFDQIFVMTPGGSPAKTTLTLGYLVYEQGFRNFAMGSASAIALVLFAMILTVYLFQRLFIKEGGVD